MGGSTSRFRRGRRTRNNNRSNQNSTSHHFSPPSHSPPLIPYTPTTLNELEIEPFSSFNPPSLPRFPPLYIISYTQTSEDESQRPRRLILLIFGDRNDEEDGFQRFLNRLFELHESRGPPPADPKEIEKLPSVVLTETLTTEQIRCTVCCEEFKVGSVGIKLPCEHIFDKDCIEHWLKEHNTCPICRYELPVEDPEYEKQRVERMAARGFPIPVSSPTSTEIPEKLDNEEQDSSKISFEPRNSL